MNTPELASVLPDFVQDHLVVEQCYLADSGSTLDIDNLPDFALSGSAADLDLPLDLGQRASNEQLPFDLTQLNSRLNFNAPQRNTSSNSNDSFRLPSNIYMNRPSDRVLNLDLAQSNVLPSSNETLPLDLAQGSAHLGNISGNTGTRPANESLPCDLGLGNAQVNIKLFLFR